MRSPILRSKNLLIRAVVRTDAGCVRRNNQDNSGFTFLQGSKNDFIAVLADGMGGYERGEEASEAMVRTVCTDPHQKIGKNPKRWLLELFKKANSHIYALSRQYRATMGTTCSTLLIWRKNLWCAHIGDSRIYLLSKEKLTQLTCDHKVAATSSVLTKAIGTSPHIEPDIFKLNTPVQNGDRFLLCSDGLYDLVSDAEIFSLFSQKSLRKAAASLIDAAKGYGGHDNITVLLVEITEKTAAEHDES